MFILWLLKCVDTFSITASNSSGTIIILSFFVLIFGFSLLFILSKISALNCSCLLVCVFSVLVFTIPDNSNIMRFGYPVNEETDLLIFS